MNNSLNTLDDALKCGNCSFPLSFPPIHHNSTFGNICGRCQELLEKHAELLFERQTLYEEIAKKLRFPCSFQEIGCKAELGFDTANTHETVCPFKVTNLACPLFHCKWIGKNENLCRHIEEKHEEYFPNPLQMTLTKEFGTTILFSKLDGKLVMIIFHFDVNLNVYHCCILSDMSFNACKEYSYEIDIYSEHSNDPIIFKGGKLECMLKYISPDNSLVIPTASFNHLFENSDEITVKFSILQRTVTKTGSLSNLNEPSEASQVYMKVLHELDCPICADFMAAPIYVCRAGHNICNRCQVKVQDCPVCREMMLGGRNFTLEKLASTIKGPCANRMNGCSYVASMSQVKTHEQNCSLTIRDCVINDCQWNGSTLTLPEHLEEEHSFLQLDKIYVHQLEHKTKEYLIIYDEKIFILFIDFKNKESFNYNLHHFGKSLVQYEFQLELGDISSMCNAMVLEHICHPLNYNFDKCSLTLISVPSKIIRHFLKDNKLHFKINIHTLEEDLCTPES